MVFNPDDARDVLQDVNIVLFRKQSYFVVGTNFKAWAFAIARYECLRYLSNFKKREFVTLDTGLLESLAQKSEEVVDDVDPHLAALKNCMEELPDEARELLAYRYTKKRSLELVASDWKTSVGALKQKLFRTRARLKKCIEMRMKIQK